MLPRPRVVVVDDDAAIRRLVAMALEELDIDLVSCADGNAALAALHQAPARLLITDLMMPGLSGWALLQHLVDEPSLRAGARLVVFSAGLDAQARERLAGLPVWQTIHKPVSMLALAETVAAALADDGTAAPEPVAVSAPFGEAAAVAAHFGGDEALFHAFRNGCLAQFPDDLRQAQAAWNSGDASALRRMAHSLKSVLLLLGETEASATARRLEHAAEAGDWATCHRPWQALRMTLERLIG